MLVGKCYRDVCDVLAACAQLQCCFRCLVLEYGDFHTDERPKPPPLVKKTKFLRLIESS